MTDRGRAEALRHLDVSRETLDRLDAFVEGLVKWNASINLVSRSTLDTLWVRHILDSAQLYDRRPTDAQRWADLGTGGGFPGLVIGILGAADGLHMTCIEADIRKASFLRTTATAIGVPLNVLSRRIEDAPPQAADVVSARALAPLDTLLAHSQRHLRPGGHALVLKGRQWRDEVDRALANWAFDLETYVSRTDADSVVLSIGGIARV